MVVFPDAPTEDLLRLRLAPARVEPFQASGTTAASALRSALGLIGMRK